MIWILARCMLPTEIPTVNTTQTLRHIAHCVPSRVSRISFSKEHAHTCRVVKSNYRPGKQKCINHKRQFLVFVRCNLFWRVWLRTFRVTVDSRICARSVGQNGVNRLCDFRLSLLVANHRAFRTKTRVYPLVASFLSSAHRDPPRAFLGPSYMSYEDGMPAGGNSRFRGYPARMSERQQLALLLQMTSQEIVSGKKNEHSI